MFGFYPLIDRSEGGGDAGPARPPYYMAIALQVWMRGFGCLSICLSVCLARAHAHTHSLTLALALALAHAHGFRRSIDRSTDRWQESLATSGIPEYLRIVLKPVVDVILSGADPLTASRADLLFQVRQRQVGIGAKWDEPKWDGAKWESGPSGNRG
jgi:hypothetical protein